MELETKNNIQKILSDFIKDAKQYKSWQNKTCFRQFGNIEYYCLLCNKLNLQPKCICSGLSYEATKNGISLDYCEHDIILSFELLDYEQSQKSKNKNFLEYSVFNNEIRIVDCSFNDEKQILFGCWLKDGKDWQVLGYAEQ